MALSSHLFGVVVSHAGWVVNGQHDLVLSLAGLGATQPDLVLAELWSNVRDHLAHVQTLASAVVSPETWANMIMTLFLLLFLFLQLNLEIHKEPVKLCVKLFSYTYINACVQDHSDSCMVILVCVCVCVCVLCVYLYKCMCVFMSFSQEGGQGGRGKRTLFCASIWL